MYSVDHFFENQGVLGSIYQGIPCYDNLQRIQYRSGDCSGYQSVHNNVERGFLEEIIDHLKTLELNCRVKSFTDKINL